MIKNLNDIERRKLLVNSLFVRMWLEIKETFLLRSKIELFLKDRFLYSNYIYLTDKIKNYYLYKKVQQIFCVHFHSLSLEKILFLLNPQFHSNCFVLYRCIKLYRITRMRKILVVNISKKIKRWHFFLQFTAISSFGKFFVPTYLRSLSTCKLCCHIQFLHAFSFTPQTEVPLCFMTVKWKKDADWNRTWQQALNGIFINLFIDC